MTGIVRTLKTDKGFGFITAMEGQDYFFHRSEFKGHWDDLCEDFNNNVKVAVMFEEDESKAKGLRAKNVRRMDHPNAA